MKSSTVVQCGFSRLLWTCFWMLLSSLVLYKYYNLGQPVSVYTCHLSLSVPGRYIVVPAKCNCRMVDPDLGQLRYTPNLTN